MTALAILGIALLALTGTIWYFYNKVKRFARENFGTDNLQDIIQNQEEMMAETPKSVSGMTSLYLPRLQKDFPELNWTEFQKTAEGHLMEHLQDQQLSRIRIHQTALRDYRKNSGTCYAVLQSAVEFYKDDKKIQSRFDITMAYVQDAAKAGYENAVSLTCPNCGAPISNLGSKSCEYCGSAVREINIRVWRLETIKEL